mgnify:CR=1 FL=1
MSSIRAIAIKNRPRVAMQVIDSAKITVENGILGDFRGTQQGRQITILSESAWRKACAEIDADLPWTTRRVNLLVDEVEFDASYVGKTVRIGDVELMVTEETDPCSRMDAQHQGLTAALTPDWRGGISCNVIKPGDIKIGDQIDFD